MGNTIDTFMALEITLNGIAAGNYSLDQNGYDNSEIWEQLAEGKVTLIEYLENEYHQHHNKGPLMNRLTISLNAALELINAALDDDSQEVYHDWRAVAGLCQDWVNTIDDYYRRIPYRAEDFPPGSIARSYLANLERMERRDMMAPQEPAAPRPAGRPSQHGKTIKDYMWLKDDKQKEKLLKKLHQLIDGRKGKAVALVIVVCSAMGLMEKPGHLIMVNEFGDIGNRSGYDRYFSKGYRGYTDEETKGIEKHLAPFKVALSSNKSPHK